MMPAFNVLGVQAGEENGEEGRNTTTLRGQRSVGTWGSAPREVEASPSYRDTQIDPAPKGDRAPGIDHGLKLYLVSASILGFQKKGGQSSRTGCTKVVGAGLRSAVPERGARRAAGRADGERGPGGWPPCAPCQPWGSAWEWGVLGTPPLRLRGGGLSGVQGHGRDSGRGTRRGTELGRPGARSSADAGVRGGPQGLGH